MRPVIDGLLTEERNPASVNIDVLTTEEMLHLMNEEDKKAVLAVEREIPRIAKAVEVIAGAFGKGGRLVYVGAGTSGRLGVLDAAECPPTFGVDPGLVIGVIAGGEQALIRSVEGAEDNEDEFIEQLKIVKLNAADVVVGIAASGRTPCVLGGLKYANALGAFTIAICCTPEPEAGKVARLTITPLAGPEVIAGSTRLKAGTATKLVLNMLTTASMVRRGKVYGNLMVDVQPTNAKLVERAKRIVTEVAGVSGIQATAALERAGWNAKTAIVMLKLGCSAEEAAVRLASAGGFIRKAINELEGE